MIKVIKVFSMELLECTLKLCHYIWAQTHVQR